MAQEISERVTEFLRIIHTSGGLEIDDCEELAPRMARLLEQAFDGGLIRDDSSGWDYGARFVLTNEGRRMIGLYPVRNLFEALLSIISATGKRLASR